MAEAARSALVVLNPGHRAGVPPERAGEVPPPPEVVRSVVAAFSDDGFDLGPFVGISFAISGSPALFRRVFGIDPQAGDFAGPDLPLERLNTVVVEHVAAVTVTEPPAFGPGNP